MVNDQEDKDAARVAESRSLIWCNEKNRQCTKDCSHYKRCHPITPEAPASTTGLITLWRGKLLTDLTREELIEALKDAGRELYYWHQRVLYTKVQ